MAVKTRLDAELVRRGLARSRRQAQELVETGRVRVRGIVATKVATGVDGATPVTVTEPAGTGADYVSRGGHKLAGALADLAGPPVTARRCLDAGASTGGFTDVLLRAGAGHVVAVDVGYGQLAWPLRNEPRVTVVERTNARDLDPAGIGGPVDLAVADLSFISLRVVLPALDRCVDPRGDMLLLVKPQFEVGRDRVGAGGVVRDPADRADAVRSVAAAAFGIGWGTRAVTASRLPGPAGNVEYFLWLRRDAVALVEPELRRAIEDGPQ